MFSSGFLLNFQQLGMQLLQEELFSSKFNVKQHSNAIEDPRATRESVILLFFEIDPGKSFFSLSFLFESIEKMFSVTFLGFHRNGMKSLEI